MAVNCTIHLPNYNTGTTTCVGNRATCGANAMLTGVWDGNVLQEPITAARVEDLRLKIRSQITAYDAHSTFNAPLYEPNPIVVGGVVSATTPNNLANMVNSLYATGYVVQNATTPVTHSAWDQLVTRYNVVRQNCVCNSDCSCNAVCACHGDCGCNYSDRRLKDSIVYI